MDPLYVPMGSQHLYRSYAEYFLGRPPASQDELDRMNLRIQGSPTHTWIMTGYDQRFFQQCIPALAFFKGLCIAGLGSEQTNLSPVREFSSYSVITQAFNVEYLELNFASRKDDEYPRLDGQ